MRVIVRVSNHLFFRATMVKQAFRGKVNFIRRICKLDDFIDPMMKEREFRFAVCACSRKEKSSDYFHIIILCIIKQSYSFTMHIECRGGRILSGTLP